MIKLKIQTGKDNEILRTISKEVSDLSKKTPNLNLNFDDLVKGLINQLDAEKGLGIAASQVGENVRICLCRFNSGTDNEILFVLVNPEITWKSEDTEVGEEGCLSLSKYYVNVVRAKNVTVKFLDGKALLKGGKIASKSGKKLNLSQITLNLSGLNARVIQHEIDHLNGVLICDRAVGESKVI